MLPQFKRVADGGLTLFNQNPSAHKDKEANWLPAPKEPFWMAMRLDWPKAEALQGKWTAKHLDGKTTYKIHLPPEYPDQGLLLLCRV